jgi:electron-transferring-flavoprotein dehydrogenase
MSQEIERERLDVDILFVGAGAATLAAAIRLADLCRESGTELPQILVIEKAAEIGGHQLSGAVIDPRAIRELFPDFMEQGFPLQYECTKDAVYFLTKKRAIRSPLTPPMLANHGNLVVSLSDLVKWLGAKAEERGIEITPASRRCTRCSTASAYAACRSRTRASGGTASRRACSSRAPRSTRRWWCSGRGRAARAPRRS